MKVPPRMDVGRRLVKAVSCIFVIGLVAAGADIEEVVEVTAFAARLQHAVRRDDLGAAADKPMKDVSGIIADIDINPQRPIIAVV
jgi:hypothetical protein